MSTNHVIRDERTVTVENESYRWAYTFLMYGVLLSAFYRAYFAGQNTLDLMGLVIMGGFITLLYQVRNKTLNRPMLLLFYVLPGLIVGIVTALWLFLRG